ncbi:MAG TPA: hypothetical protein VNK67_14170 [Burkholderiales bacterium]|nr:hypothetical protein [Burkholderiales bacterium]
MSAELKLDKAGLMVAFGQACAYKLFSHKSYIVVPSDSSEEDIGRLDVLCRTLGVGLILFNPDNAASPDFQIRVRAARYDPDMFYINRYMKLLEVSCSLGTPANSTLDQTAGSPALAVASQRER